MEWLKDKKNLPIVAGLGVVVLLLAIAAILFETGVIGGGGQAGADATATAPAPPPPAPGGPPPPTDASVPAPGGSAGPAAPGGPSTPGAPAKPAVKVAANVAKGPDPFNVPKVPGQTANPGQSPKPTKPSINSFVPPISIARMPPSNGLGVGGGNTGGGTNTPTPPPLSVPNIRLTTEESQTMRVSGVVLTNGNGIRAVLEANGQSLTVQPGDAVPGGTVVSIQADGLTMRADDGRLIHVPISNGMAGNPQGG